MEAKFLGSSYRCDDGLTLGWLGGPDPDDDRILEVAVRTGSPIVTFNVRDFRGAERFGIRTMSPFELLGVIGALK
jgi:hypothetical protein